MLLRSMTGIFQEKMNTITLITAISFSILIISVIGDFIVNKPQNKWGAIFNYAIALSSTFIGITLGLYFTELDGQYQEEQSTIKYLEIALNDIEIVQDMILDDYFKEAEKYYGKDTEDHEALYVESLADFHIPFPETIKTIIGSSSFPKYISARLFHKLNFCFHNLHNFKGALESKKSNSEADYQQLLENLKNYITLLSYNYFVISTELKYLNDEISHDETDQHYEEGYKKTILILKSEKLNEFLNRQLLKEEFKME